MRTLHVGLSEVSNMGKRVKIVLRLSKVNYIQRRFGVCCCAGDPFDDLVGSRTVKESQVPIVRVEVIVMSLL